MPFIFAGHPLEEIRVRALSSIISKYNLNLVDESNLQNTKALLEKLFDWFNFDKFSEEKKVLNLLLKILQNNNARLVFSEIGINNVFEKTNKIEKKIGSKYPLIIEEIKQCIRKIENESKEQNYQHLNGIHSEGKLSTVLHLNNNKYDFPKARNCKSGGDFHAGGKSSAKVIQSEFNRANKDGVKEKNFSDEMVDNAKPKSAFKVEYFPWQHLVPNDKQVLSSVFDGLKYIDDKISILQSCQFFTETVLRDFPPEIFIQRPLIVRTLLQLVEKTHNDIKISVIKCLIKTACCLKSSLSLSLNPSLFNQKKEFYTTSVYPNDALQNGSGDSAQQKLPSRFHLNFTCHDEGLNSIHEGDINEQKLKKYQLSLPEFCFEVLMQVLPQLKKKCSQEEENYLIELINEFLKCLFLNLKSDIWHSHSGLRSKFYKIFGLIQELLKHHKKKDKIIYVIFLNIVIKLLKSLKPPSKMEIHDILPKSLHLELAFSILDCSVYLMFPHLHTELIKYVRQFPGHQEREIYQDYKDVVMILESMKSCATFLKTPGKLKTKMEKLEYVYHALPSLHFHENFDFIRCFVGSCLLKWSKSEMKSTELKLREKVLLKLLSHSNNRVKIYIYREISDYAVKLLGEKEAANPTYEFPGDKMEFLFHVDVLTEIICHGLNSELAEVTRKMLLKIFSFELVFTCNKRF